MGNEDFPDDNEVVSENISTDEEPTPEAKKRSQSVHPSTHVLGEPTPKPGQTPDIEFVHPDELPKIKREHLRLIDTGNHPSSEVNKGDEPLA